MAWNRPKENADADARAHQGTRRAFSVRLGPVAALVAVAGALVWWLWPEGDGRLAPPVQDRPERSVIKAVAPAKVAKPVEVAEGPKKGDSSSNEIIRIGNIAYDLTKLRAEDPAKYARVTGEYARVQAQLEKFRREPVQGLAEQLLVMVSPLKKGDFIPPPPIDLEGNPQLEREAEAMLERVGQVEEWDDEASIGIKERLEALKDEWYAAKKAGQSFHEFLAKRLNAANFDTTTLEEARRFDAANYEDREMSDADYEKAHEKVNKLLEMQGFEKIKRPDEEESDGEATAVPGAS